MHTRGNFFLLRLFVFLVIAAVNGCGSGDDSSLTGGRSLVEIVGSGDSELFAIPFDSYKENTKNLPIGVFDSGIGGLTVLAEILDADSFDNDTRAPGADGIPDFENERFVYLGDQANMPYGNYPSEGKVDFLKELIIKDAVFILGNRYWLNPSDDTPRYDKPPVKAIVIACNTATAYGLEDVRAALESWGLPVYLVGVVEAGARGAVEALKETGGGAVAVMATVGTCSSGGYPRAVEKIAGEEGIASPEVTQQGSLGLAGAIEGDETFVTDPVRADATEYKGPAADNTAAPIEPSLADRYGFEPEGLLGDLLNPSTWRLNSVDNYVRYDTTMLVDAHSGKQGAPPISAVILGCTHFPFHEEKIAASFDRLRDYTAPDGSRPYANAIAENLTFIDPSVITAEELFRALADTGGLLDCGERSLIPVDEFYISVPNTDLDSVRLTETGGFTYEYKYGRVPGNFTVEYVKRVPMCRNNLTEHVRESIRSTMPEVWRRLVLFNHESPRTRDLPEGARVE